MNSLVLTSGSSALFWRSRTRKAILVEDSVLFVVRWILLIRACVEVVNGVTILVGLLFENRCIIDVYRHRIAHFNWASPLSQALAQSESALSLLRPRHCRSSLRSATEMDPSSITILCHSQDRAHRANRRCRCQCRRCIDQVLFPLVF